MSTISQEKNPSKAFTASKAISPSIASPLRKVLIITYYWPPSGGAGVQRWLKFARYLPEFGWEPVILTVDPEFAAYPQKDEGLLKEISNDLEIIQTKSSNGIFSVYKKLTGQKETPYGGFANESNPGLMQKIFRFLRGNFFLPDARTGWNRYAFNEALKIIREKNIDLVITTSPPHSTQLVGLKIRKKLNIKWIADLRDPWSDVYYAGDLYQTRLATKVNEQMEKNVLKSADKVVATCNSTRDLFRSKLPADQSPDKIITITNGYDESDFVDIHQIPETFTITYLGTFAKNYDIDILINAIDYYAAKTGDGINLQFVGRIDENTIKILRKSKNISLQLIPYVEHNKALEYLSASAALLLVVPSTTKADEMIPAKLFEYLAAKRPVISIGPKDGDVAKILKETMGGRMFDNTQLNELGEYLLEIKNNFNNKKFESDSIGTENYSRKNLTQKIAGIMDLS